MLDILSRNLYLVKEHVGMFKAANNYDIYDPESGAEIMECREESLGIFTKILRFTDYKRMTPFDIQIKSPEGRQVVRVKRGFRYSSPGLRFWMKMIILSGFLNRSFFR